MDDELMAMAEKAGGSYDEALGGSGPPTWGFTVTDLAEFAALVASRCAEEVRASAADCDLSNCHAVAEIAVVKLATRWRQKAGER